MTDHIHKYFKVIQSPTWTIFRCVLPDCSHYINEKFMPGKNCICWVCNKPFNISPTMNFKLLAKKPACCRGKKKKEVEEKEIGDIMKDLGL